MNKFLALGLLLGILSACAPAATTVPTQAPLTVAPAPTAMPAATSAPRSPAAPQTLPPQPSAPAVAPTRSSVKITGAQTSTTDGTVSTTANVTTEGLGVGQIEISSPEKMSLSESKTVRLKLSPSKQIASITPVALPATSPDLPGTVWNVAGNVQLYPVMFAELRTLKFDVSSTTSSQQRNIGSPNNTVEWSWLISPKALGQQDLSIEISFLAVVNGATSELNTLQNIPLTILVQAPPAPTPVPVSSRIMDSLLNNSGAIIVALIGLIGTLIGILVKLRSDQDKDAKNKK